MIAVLNNTDRIETKKVTVILSEDVEFDISISKFGDEVTINKKQFGNGETSMIIKPSVSNEIRIS